MFAILKYQLSKLVSNEGGSGNGSNSTRPLEQDMPAISCWQRIALQKPLLFTGAASKREPRKRKRFLPEYVIVRIRNIS